MAASATQNVDGCGRRRAGPLPSVMLTPSRVRDASPCTSTSSSRRAASGNVLLQDGSGAQCVVPPIRGR